MSIHTSFGKGGALKKHRSVVKRYEKIQILQKKDLWDESKGSLGLPKVKMVRIKAKKDKKEEAAAEGQAAAPATGAPAEKPAAKAAAKPAKKEAKKE